MENTESWIDIGINPLCKDPGVLLLSNKYYLLATIEAV